MMGIGKVWLVGAGPSNPGLITVRAMQLLERADVVVYDYLVGMGILGSIPQETELICVGKRAGHHSASQDEINAILVREAKLGKMVVRLKGGDPFLFGRGGEEVKILLENDIPFGIVPGVTSAIAAPAYGGIPVTDRECSSSVHIITGKGKDGRLPNTEYESLVKAGGTLVFLMGLGSMKQICINLIRAGMDESTPAAVVENGTSARQKRVVGTVSDLSDKANIANIQTPAVIIVGEVCKFAKDFDWIKNLPLNGKRILVTRPKPEAENMLKRLSELGAEVAAFPTIEIKEISPNPRLREAIQNLSSSLSSGWIAFTSPNGVRIFFEQIALFGYDIRKLARIKIAAIGSATARKLLGRGIIPDYVPETYYAKSLAEGLCKHVGTDEKVIIPRAQEGSQLLTQILTQNAISYEDIPIYETRICKSRADIFIPMIRSGGIDFVTFTSASTVRGFAQCMQDEDLSQIKGIFIGEQTANFAHKYGIDGYTAKECSIESMVNLIVELSR